jgi:hypothetical protein
VPLAGGNGPSKPGSLGLAPSSWTTEKLGVNGSSNRTVWQLPGAGGPQALFAGFGSVMWPSMNGCHVGSNPIWLTMQTVGSR